MAKYKVNNPDEYEVIDIKVSEKTYPKIFSAKVNEYVSEGMNEKEARKFVEGMIIPLELCYDSGNGLFGIEPDAIQSCVEALYNPYTGENLEDCD